MNIRECPFCTILHDDGIIDSLRCLRQDRRTTATVAFTIVPPSAGPLKGMGLYLTAKSIDFMIYDALSFCCLFYALDSRWAKSRVFVLLPDIIVNIFQFYA